MSEITESEERLARPLIRLAKLVGVGTSYLGMSHDYHEIDDDVLIEVLQRWASTPPARAPNSSPSDAF